MAHGQAHISSVMAARLGPCKLVWGADIRRNSPENRTESHCAQHYVGAKLRVFWLNGQIPAGMRRRGNDRLAVAGTQCKLNGPCGSTLPAPHMHLLFRTPSFRGQACVSYTDLPAFFFARALQCARQNPAQYPLSRVLLLNIKAGFVHLPGNSPRNQKGQNTCESHEHSLHWRPVPALRHAATQLANRRCLAVARARWGQLSSTPTRSSGQRLAPRATFCTAKQRATVANSEFSGRTSSRPMLCETPLRGSNPATAFLRIPNTKTKDVPCSTRS